MSGRNKCKVRCVHCSQKVCKMLVFVLTGGETHGGSLYMIRLDDLYKGQVNKVSL